MSNKHQGNRRSTATSISTEEEKRSSHRRDGQNFASSGRQLGGVRGWWAKNQRQLMPYIFLAPNLLVFGAFMAFPILFAFYVSVHEWSLIGDSEFTGLANYGEIATDQRFWQSLTNTIVYTVGVVPSSIAIGLAIAVLLNRQIPGRALLRSIYFLPVIISGVVTAIIASWMFDDVNGIINAILQRVGIDSVPWLSSPFWAMLALIMATLWIRIGFCMVIYLAALQSIPEMYYDAAKVDGASKWSRFRHVTWPLLGPATLLLIIMNVIFSFHVFDIIYVMTGGGPGFSTTVLVQYIYQQAFDGSNLGYASAMGMVLYLLIVIFSIVQWRISRGSQAVQ